MERMFSLSLRHSNDDLGYRRKEQKNKIGERLIRVVTEFRERDDNSRIKAGKQGTITRKNVKKQKRLLNDELVNLHAKFQSEHVDINISYSLFCKLRPVCVIKPTDKDTCFCIKHENLQYQCDRLFREKTVDNQKLETFIAQICCSTATKALRYKECDSCKDKTMVFLLFYLYNCRIL